MNNTDYRGTVRILVDVITTAVNLSIMAQISKNCYRCNRNYSRLGKVSNENANYILKKQQFVKKEKINDKRYYAEDIKKLRYLLDEAYQQMQQGQYRYAIYDANSVMRETIKILLWYKNRGYAMDDLLMNIKICERKKLLGADRDFINRLYEVYHICGCERQRLDKGKYINDRKVHFVIMQLKDLLNFVEREIIYS
ncbi:hypothetical protein [Roseburia hominis]|uniref:hypothetical protein n=1 Tax=Roseburia hominis TaxID=301301 RepID=UPI0026590840|nr:hypothetical protein [Roseburia hominis]